MNQVWVFCPGGTVNSLICVMKHEKSDETSRKTRLHNELKLCGPISEQLVPANRRRLIKEPFIMI